jgi:hypothetical protein
MAGPLSSERPVAEGTLTGGSDTSVSREINQDFKQVLRSRHMDRPQRTGAFEVDGRPPVAKNVNQKSRGLSNLREKSSFKRRRLRK